MPAAHSKHSASNFEANMLCPGRPVLSAGLRDSSSKYADEGTAAHELLTIAMTQGRPAAAYAGRVFTVGEREFEANDDMIAAVQVAIDNANDIAGGGTMLLDRRVNYSRYLGVSEEDGWGTLDIASVRGYELQIHDYKHGRGVDVDAGHDVLNDEGALVRREPNAQMALYALGALEELDDVMGPFTAVRLIIHQPRTKSAPSEYVMPVAALLDWAKRVAKPAVMARAAAESAFKGSDAEWEAAFLRPNDKSCKFCKAKATCPALRADVVQAVFETPVASPDDFDDLRIAETPKQSDAAWLSKVLGKADMIEGYIKAVRAEVESRLLQGADVPGWKLVQGKRGNRKWLDEKDVEKTLKSLDVDDKHIYTSSMNSPAAIEKLVKSNVITKDQFATLITTQTDGVPHVAPATDKRPAITVASAADDFETL